MFIKKTTTKLFTTAILPSALLTPFVQHQEKYLACKMFG